MKILINAVAAKMGGGLRHLQNFVRALAEVDRAREYFVFVDSAIREQLITATNIHIFPIAFAHKSFIHAFYWHQVIIPKLVGKYGIDLVLSILNFGPINTSARQIVFQRNSLYFCKRNLQRLRWQEKVHTLFCRWLLYKTMNASEIIVTPTNTMRDIIRETYPQIPEQKFQIIPHGLDVESFLHSEVDLPPAVTELLKQAAGSIKLLYVSHPAPHKGFEVLLKAVKILVDKGINLKLLLTIARSDRPKVVIGYEKLIDSLGINDQVLVLGRVPADAVVHLYKTADIFIFPSWSESFGYPLLEAQIIGVPIIAADTEVNREMAGNNAQYYDPFSPAALASKIQAMISRAGGKKTMQTIPILSWRDYAKKIIKLF